ncbi:Uncharacterized protein conserved in bacteria [Mycoplasmopsis californica]|uniref:Probable cell division protein WhiA n=1 Tax=Mycoplasmopsis equigenitalium TaxID=114883 RepID=A0ABY5J3A8_9BACT|nr:DNA-binding protein WhiA [Mycoplasmopsis equigenitalium]UUD37016.1 DNA-binding protein WhiA [Mycoplasmopsis equigenitalium]VEU69685.1 Uncharacterized protein conserved in bacteria [Mycoplasmopsis californica]
MTFAHKIKNEIMSKDLALPQLKSLINGMIISSSKQDENFFYVLFNNKKVRTFFIESLKFLEIDYAVILNKKQVIIPNEDYEFKIDFSDKTAFFAGMFLGAGSINKIDSTYYHLQLSTYKEWVAQEVAKILNAYENFDFKVTKQGNKYILYIKKIDAICDFLRAIATPIAYLELENIKIQRDFQNNLNRQGNIDIVNINKTLKANEEFIEMFNFIKKNKLTKYFSDDQLAYFKLRFKNSEWPLSAFVEHLNKSNITITKSGLNHWNKKLKSLYNQLKMYNNDSFRKEKNV